MVGICECESAEQPFRCLTPARMARIERRHPFLTGEGTACDSAYRVQEVAGNATSHSRTVPSLSAVARTLHADEEYWSGWAIPSANPRVRGQILVSPRQDLTGALTLGHWPHGAGPDHEALDGHRLGAEESETAIPFKLIAELRPEGAVVLQRHLSHIPAWPGQVVRCSNRLPGRLVYGEVTLDQIRDRPAWSSCSVSVRRHGLGWQGSSPSSRIKLAAGLVSREAALSMGVRCCRTRRRRHRGRHAPAGAAAGSARRPTGHASAPPRRRAGRFAPRRAACGRRRWG